MYIQHILTIFGLVFASTGFWQFVTAWWNKKTDKRSVIEEGLMALLHDRIYELSKQYISVGCISDSEHKNLTVLFESYTALHGNGTAKRLMEEVDRLPIKED